MILFFLVLFVLVGFGMMTAAFPLIQRRIAPNGLYGVRLPETLGDEATWYRVNEAFGRWLFGAGAATALVAFCLYLVPSFRGAHGNGIVGPMIVYVTLCNAVVCVGIFAAIVSAQREIALRVPGEVYGPQGRDY